MIRFLTATAVLAAFVASAAPAQAAGPPAVDPGAIGPALGLAGAPHPPDPTEQRSICAQPLWSGGAAQDVSPAQQVLDLPAAWQFSRGAGQKVAVIDTGVHRHPRLPVLQAGGDYVSGTDGTVDCDGHGTLVAGIIAGRPSPDDAFVGVAPEAAVLTIRQLSLAFESKNRSGSDKPGDITPTGYGNVLTLAAAVVRAVNLGATVINISEVACAQTGSSITDAALGAAVKYAYDRNVVVVAAAGNLASDGACKEQNTGSGWNSVRTTVSPARFVPYVLSVASVDPDGGPSQLSMNGPWVGAAAIGRSIVSLDSKPGGTGLVNGVQTAEGVRPVEGTSFAAPYVAGLAALVRSRFPTLSAQQVMDRITRTAHAPGNGRDDLIGHGLIDPLAALTAKLPDQPVSAGADVARVISSPAPPYRPDPLPRRIAGYGALVCLGLLAIGFALSVPYRRPDRGKLIQDVDY